MSQEAGGKTGISGQSSGGKGIAGRIGITGKLFLLTAFVFLVFLVLEVLFFNYFLNEFYIYRKIDTARESLNSYAHGYSQGGWSFKQAIDEADRFAAQHNAAVIIINKDGVPVHGSSQGLYSRMTLEDESGRYYQVYLDYLKERPAFAGFEPRAGDALFIEGVSYQDEPGFIEPYSIQSSSAIFADPERLKEYRDPATQQLDEGVTTVRIAGTVVYVQQMPDTGQYENIDPRLYRQDLLMRHVSEWLNGAYVRDEIRQSLGAGQVVQEEFMDPVAGQNYIFLARELQAAGELRYICTVISLQPVDEAIGAITDYLLYYFLLALVFIIILSLVYSQMIARPLLQMNELAGRMANLDFSALSRVKSRDELGQLSASLNSLSRNLQQSLQDLEKANQQLLSDIEKERRQEEKRREFVTGISHELKTPLGIIRSFSEGIRDGIYREKQGHYLDVIIDETAKMDSLISEMLDLSYLESDNIKLHPEDFELDQLICQCQAQFVEYIKEKGMRFSFEVAGFRVHADRRRIEQVLGNLFSNAVRYSPPGAIITVSLDRRAGLVFTRIENSGAHIDESEIPRIWERFYRLDKSRSRDLGGTGLGLLIVRHIMELHHCDYGARNTASGVEFYFALPEAPGSKDNER